MVRTRLLHVAQRWSQMWWIGRRLRASAKRDRAERARGKRTRATGGEDRI